MGAEGFRAIVFDLDGVLVDSEPVHYAAEVELLARFGFQFSQDVWQTMKGLTDDAFFTRLRDLGLDTPLSNQELARQKLAVMLRMMRERLEPFPGAAATVRRLADRPLALTTSSPRPMVELALGILGLEGVFSVVVTGDDVSRGKPDPEPFLLTAARLAVEPARCLAVEDSVHGVASAVAAGMICVAVEHSFPAAALPGAHRVVERIADLPAALQELEPAGLRPHPEGTGPNL